MLGSWIARVGAVALLAVAAVLGGCGGGGDAAEADSTAGTTSPPATAPPSFNAGDAVIALSDLPAGWAVEPDDDDDENNEFCGQNEGVAALVGVEAVSEAEAEFAEGGNIPALANAVGAFAPGDAEAVFDKFEEIVADCSSFESEGTTFEVAPVSFPAQGDESIPLLASAEIEGFTVTLYFVFVRVADGITIVGYGDLGPDVAEVEKYVQLAVTKLRQAQGIPG